MFMMQMQGNTSEEHDGNLRHSLQERCESPKCGKLRRLIRRKVAPAEQGTHAPKRKREYRPIRHHEIALYREVRVQ